MEYWDERTLKIWVQMTVTDGGMIKGALVYPYMEKKLSFSGIDELILQISEVFQRTYENDYCVQSHQFFSLYKSWRKSSSPGGELRLILTVTETAPYSWTGSIKVYGTEESYSFKGISRFERLLCQLAYKK